MIYKALEAQAALLDVMRPMAAAMATTLKLPWPGLIPRFANATLASKLDAFSVLKITAERPAFGLEPVLVGNALVGVHEEAAATTPFATLVHFRKHLSTIQPRVLVVAPMSGHFATLLRATVQTLLIDHDVYITDWHNVRDVPKAAGPFTMATYVETIMQFQRAIGEGAHVVAVCQPTVPALAAVALMAEDDEAATPRSLTLMAGPIDARINPTAVNKLAADRPIRWFEENLIDVVPPWFKGYGRKVYPGRVQLAAFIGMNPERHKKAFADMAIALADGDDARFNTIKSFYDEYLAVMDLSADFYLETVRDVFQEHALPLGKLTVGTRRVDLRAIRRVALLTVEGERDDICGLGQTMAAQELCASVRPYRKTHHVQTGVGHYGVFSGRRWVSEIYPKVRDTIAMAS